MIDTLQEMIKKPVHELVEYLQVFGNEHAISSGCRIYLLLQVLDLFEGEAQAIGNFIPGVVPKLSSSPSDTNTLIKPASFQPNTPAIAAKRKLPAPIFTNFSGPSMPKIAKSATCTVTSATATTAGSASSQQTTFQKFPLSNLNTSNI
jgi:hypothetical protein